MPNHQPSVVGRVLRTASLVVAPLLVASVAFTTTTNGTAAADSSGCGEVCSKSGSPSSWYCTPPHPPPADPDDYTCKELSEGDTACVTELCGLH